MIIVDMLWAGMVWACMLAMVSPSCGHHQVTRFATSAHSLSLALELREPLPSIVEVITTVTNVYIMQASDQSKSFTLWQYNIQSHDQYLQSKVLKILIYSSIGEWASESGNKWVYLPLHHCPQLWRRVSNQSITILSAHREHELTVDIWPYADIPTTRCTINKLCRHYVL
jgi:hypothetical protein